MRKLLLLLVSLLLIFLSGFGQRVYSDVDGNFRVNDNIYPKNEYRLTYGNGKTSAAIYGKDNYFELVKFQPISSYLDESGTPYTDAAALEAALQGVISMNIFDLLNDNNFAIKVQLGQIRGVYAVNKFGENSEIATTTDPEAIWDFGGLYNFSTSAIINSISSSNNSDVVEITIEGLDANWDVVVQTVTLTGQTRAPLTTSLLRVYRAFNNNGVDLLGNVYIYEDTPLTVGVPTDTSKIRAEIKAGVNQTEMMVYSVPAGKTMVYVEGFIAISRGGGVAASAEVTFRTREFGKAFRLRRRIALNTQGSSSWRAVYAVPVLFPEKTDIVFRVELVSATLGVSGGFQAFIFDNAIWGL